MEKSDAVLMVPAARLRYIAAVDAPEGFVEWQPVDHFFDVGIPEIPVVIAGAFLVCHIEALAAQQFAESAAVSDERIFCATGDVDFGKFQVGVGKFFTGEAVNKPGGILVRDCGFLQISESAGFKGSVIIGRYFF